MEENKGLLLKCAMSYGLAMGIYWVIKYLFLIFGYSIPSLIFIYEGLSLAVPFIAYYLTKRYRQDIGGSISFFHAWRFGIMLYFFAACSKDLMFPSVISMLDSCTFCFISLSRLCFPL